ncbi:G-protein-signaling modulator 3 isoform X2 [Enhydra lutris kenyoni]|uniref:G-protein-signaling modulator 3 n=1 Tax=Enhydra lutris kenyoni TaxID=391180 RepID=A0A2Y9K013_ENHLU|nr:G-protein-signaling modulator 3 isoform X2 [Enhydra lutris kenyoni]
MNPLHYCSWRSFSQSLCSPGAREVEQAVWVGKQNWRKLTGMGGARGGADQEPSFLLSTQASSPWLTPTPSSPHSPPEPRVPALLPNPSYPSPFSFPAQGMEAERPQEEEEDDQGPHQDEHDWPPMNTSTRPWRSAPPSPPPSGTRHTALGPRSASLLSLQTELLLDLVAEAQSRRLEEQRATFHIPQNPPSRAPAPHRPLEDREQLYSTILSHQCQRMEAQRSEPPLPPGGQELLELLLRVQGGGRMEEQRSRPPTHTC